MPRLKTGLIVAAAVASTLAITVAVGTSLAGVAPARALTQAARLVVAEVGEVVYSQDAVRAEAIAATYYIGDRPETIIPFVFERADAPHLKALRSRHDLDAVIAGPGGEYDAMLRLATWIGTRFEHGTDTVPGGNHVCDPVAVIDAGSKGASFWCEIAARTMVQAAAAVGWPARVITASTDGYTWEHAVAELWSNQFNKWVMFDPDFNIVFEADGVPLSSYELTHKGLELRRQHRLTERRFAPLKKGLAPQDVMQLFDYVHVDMRTDWCSRGLRRGSPAGGDRATWWTAQPHLAPFLPSSRNVNDPATFDWRLNAISARVTAVAQPAGQLTLIQLSTYSPTFSHFDYRTEGGAWQQSPDGRIELTGRNGLNVIEARVVTRIGSRGPSERINVRVESSARNHS
jgi:hypothetical protein